MDVWAFWRDTTINERNDLRVQLPVELPEKGFEPTTLARGGDVEPVGQQEFRTYHLHQSWLLLTTPAADCSLRLSISARQAESSGGQKLLQRSNGRSVEMLAERDLLKPLY